MTARKGFLVAAIVVLFGAGACAWWIFHQMSHGGGQSGTDGPVSAEIVAAPPASEPREPLSGAAPPPPSFAAADLDFSVTREGDVLALNGPAPDDVTGSIAAAARRIAPTLSLDPSLAAAGAKRPTSSPAIDFAVEQVARLKSGRVELRDGEIRVSGITPDKDAATAIGLALGEPPAGLRAMTPTLSSARVSPYVFVARREPGRVTLSGFVPDAATRAELTATIRKRLFDDRLVDELRLADGAPANFLAAAREGLERIAQMASGEVSLADSRLKLSGAVLYEQAATQIRDGIAKAAPAGWRAEAEITTPSP